MPYIDLVGTFQIINYDATERSTVFKNKKVVAVCRVFGDPLKLNLIA